MNDHTNTIPPDVEYHRALAGEKRRIGRGILAIALLVGGLMFFTLASTAVGALADAAIGGEGRAAYSPLIHSAGLVGVALLTPWSMLIQRWLYGVKGASLHSVISRFRFDIFGRALLFVTPEFMVVIVLQSLDPLPPSTGSPEVGRAARGPASSSASWSPASRSRSSICPQTLG